MDPEFHISGQNGICDECGKDKYKLEILDLKINSTLTLESGTIKDTTVCRLRGRRNGAIINYGISAQVFYYCILYILGCSN